MIVNGLIYPIASLLVTAERVYCSVWQSGCLRVLPTPQFHLSFLISLSVLSNPKDFQISYYPTSQILVSRSLNFSEVRGADPLLKRIKPETGTSPTTFVYRESSKKLYDPLRMDM